MAAYVRDTEHFANRNLSMVVAKLRFFRVCCVKQNFYVFSLYRNPDIYDRIWTV